MFLARLLAYGVVVGGGGGGGGGGCGRDIFRFLYIARDKPGDKQNATTAPIRYAAESDSLQSQNREFGETVISPVNANGNQSEGGRADRLTRERYARLEFECHLPMQWQSASIDRGRGPSRRPLHPFLLSRPRPPTHSATPLTTISHTPSNPAPSANGGYKQVLFIMIVDVVPELTTIRGARGEGGLNGTAVESRPSPDNS